MLLGSGIGFLIGLQALINIGVVTSTLPNKGLPLPFISYGGSSLLLMLTSIGILLSIARQAREPEPVEPPVPSRDRSSARKRHNPFKTPASGFAGNS
jgi:cell division protein FtsW